MEREGGRRGRRGRWGKEAGGGGPCLRLLLTLLIHISKKLDDIPGMSDMRPALDLGAFESAEVGEDQVAEVLEEEGAMAAACLLQIAHPHHVGLAELLAPLNLRGVAEVHVLVVEDAAAEALRKDLSDLDHTLLLDVCARNVSLVEDNLREAEGGTFTLHLLHQLLQPVVLRGVGKQNFSVGVNRLFLQVRKGRVGSADAHVEPSVTRAILEVDFSSQPQLR
mmetsp:Transcript_12609/g.44022  ORF Transcript_12609/g.44022 Transcript_12609/m.44022 type:complete len:222 (+) Transcript_12609:417-1082(+)